jgi:hypothetical protein
MTFPENRSPLFRIMLSLKFAHDPIGKPVATFPDHALKPGSDESEPTSGRLF